MQEATYTLIPVGTVQSPLTDLGTAPKQGAEGAPAAWLIFKTSVKDGLHNLQVGDEILVLTWLDRGHRDVLQVHPRDDVAAPMRGVFSTRSADRPNPIGLHRMRIVAKVDDCHIQVQPLEAVDQTPILDVKPVLNNLFES